MMPRLITLLLVLVCQGVLHAQDKESDNPTGPSGGFNGEVTTAGCYDPYTGNIRRQVTDLTVPGANGAYPLAFTRTYNSNYFSMGSDLVFGDGSNWRHSYQWTLINAAYAPGTTVPTAYTVAYPGGAAITFRPSRPIAPSQELSTFWRGPSGTADRLEVQDPSHVYLHTADGGMVNFGNATHPSSIVDPNGAITLLTYVSNNTNYLAQVTEPGGRWLKFSYTTFTYRGAGYSYNWTLLSQVQASNGQTVTYSEAATGSQTNGLGQIYPYYVLTGVSYNQEASTSGGYVHASYTYNMVAKPLPTLLTAVDPHYAGAMTNIRYAGGGLSFQEENLGTSELVSGCVITYPSSGITSSTETRGDKSSGTGNNSVAGANLTRTFTFGGVKPSLLSSVSDFEGHISYKNYYDVSAKDTDGKGFLMSTVDANNNAIYYQHEPLTGRVTQVKFADGRTRTASWRAKDDTSTLLPYCLYQTTDERGLTTTWHHYAGTGQVSQIDYPDNSHEYFQYAAFSGNGGTFYKLSCFTNRLGGQILYGYDEAGHGGSGHTGLLTSVTRSYQVGSSTTPVHEITAFTYDSFDRVIQSTDPRGIANSYSYNSRHQVVLITHVNDGSTIAVGYDDYGNCISVQDENGNKGTALYDEYRRLINVSTPVNAPNAAGSQIVSRYEAFSYLRYDNSNNVRGDALSNTNSNWGAKWLPSGSAVQRIFSPNGLCTDEYDGMYVNGSGNPIQPAVAYGFAHLGKAYNAVGQLGAETDPLGFTTTFQYDACNRLISLTDSVGHVISHGFYANGEHSAGGAQTICAGLLKSLTSPGTDASNALTATTSYTDYDPMGFVKSVLDPYSHIFSSTFDLGGDLASQTDGRNATPYLYDQLGRRIKCTYQDNTTEQWTYDASGNLSTFKNRAGAICTYQYADGRNRCTSYSWSDGTSGVSYVYSPNGLLQETSNACSDIKYVYDSSNALIAEKELTAQPTRMITRYTHDLDGNVDSITYPSGHVSCFTYDAQERVTTMYVGGATPGPTMSVYAYTGNWQTLRRLANGLETGYAYQNNGRLSYFWDYRYDSAGNPAPNGSVSIQFYGYAPDGQVSWTQRQAGGDQTGHNSPVEYNLGDAYYYYPDGTLNLAYRNINVSGGWPGQQSATADSRVNPNIAIIYGGSTATAYDQCVYDAAGNRTLAVRDYQGNPYPAADGLNRYVTWGYDNNGNATNPLLGWTYQYNAENQLIQANGPGGVVLQYFYDAAGRLIERAANGAQAFFYYAGAQRIEERNASLSLVYSYYYEAPGSDRLLCRQDATWGLLWYLYDGQGNVTHLCDNAGNVLERYLYDAFGTPTVYDPSGNQRPGGSAYDNRYLFKSEGGYEWQPQAQLYYCRERFYLPYHGRWLQPDPIGQAGGLNIYSYCANDPINNIDPSGLAGTDETGSGVYYSNGDEVPPYTSVNYGDNNQYTGYALPDGTWIDKSAVGNGDIAPQIGSTVTSPWATSAPVQWERPVLGGPQIAQDANGVGAAFAPDKPVGRAVASFQKVGETVESVVGGAVSPEVEAGELLGVPKAAKLVMQVAEEGLGVVENAAEGVAAVEARGGTYLLRDAETGQVMRTGRTNDLARRAAEHGRDPVLRDFEFEPVHRTDVYNEQRGLEQLLHDTYNPPMNKIRPISPNNPNLPIYQDAANAFLGN